MLISKDMVVKGCFSQPKIFKIIFSFLGQKIAFKNIYHTLEDFSKFNWPFKSTVSIIILCVYFFNIIRAANNHLIFRSYFKSDLHLLMFLRDFVLAILIKISYRALFFRRCPLPCKIFFSIQIFLLGTGHLQKKRAQLKSSKYFCWALFF